MQMNGHPWWRENEIRKTWWYNPQWFHEGRPFNRSTVLTYFRDSHFYDVMCNNNILEQNSQGLEHLPSMVGVEYVCDPPTHPSTSPNEPYYVIRKQWRENPTSTRLLAIYFVVGETNSEIGLIQGGVYAMPDLHSLIEHKLNAMSFSLDSMFTTLRQLVSLQQTYPTIEHETTKEEDSQIESPAEQPSLSSLGLDATTATIFSNTFDIFKTDLMHH